MEKRKYKKRIVTEKQKLILTLLYCFRFLNSKQIQQFLNHKDHRRINSWLKDLEGKGYIARDFKPIYGTLTKPAVCYLTALGRKHIKDYKNYNYYFPKYLKRIVRDNKASKSFRIRCQILADWYLTLKSPKRKEEESKEDNKNNTGKEDAKNQRINKGINNSKTGIEIVDYLDEILTNDVPKKEKIPLNTIQFFTPAYYPNFVLLDGIKPDGYMKKKTTDGINHALLFVLDAYIPRFLLRYSLKKIFDILDENDLDSDDSIKYLHVYFLCPNNKIIIYLRRSLPTFLENYYGKTLKFHLATRNQLYKKKQGKSEKIDWFTISSTDY